MAGVFEWSRIEVRAELQISMVEMSKRVAGERD